MGIKREIFISKILLRFSALSQQNNTNPGFLVAIYI